MPYLKVICNGEVIYEHEVKDNQLFKTTPVMKPVLKDVPAYWLPDNDPFIADVTFNVVEDKMYAFEFETATYESDGPAWPPAIPPKEVKPPPDPKEVAECLEKAADIIFSEGWCQGKYHVDKEEAEQLTANEQYNCDPWTQDSVPLTIFDEVKGLGNDI